MPLFVLFSVGGAAYALAAREVLHMESYEGATRVPGTAAYVAGVVHARGRAVPVVDLRSRFGLGPGRPGLDARVLIVKHKGREVALLADVAREVARIDDAAFTPASPLVTDRSTRFVAATARVGEQLIMLLDIDQVLSGEPLHDEQRQHQP